MPKLEPCLIYIIEFASLLVEQEVEILINTAQITAVKNNFIFIGFI